MDVVQSQRIVVRLREEYGGVNWDGLRRDFSEFLSKRIEKVRSAKVYEIGRFVEESQLALLGKEALSDRVLEEFSLEDEEPGNPNWFIEIGPKHGVTDNAGKTGQGAVEDFLGLRFSDEEGVRSFRRYALWGDLDRSDIEKLWKGLLGNPLIEDVRIECYDEHQAQKGSLVNTISLAGSDEQLQHLSQDRCLALNLNELHTIRKYFTQEDLQQERASQGLPVWPTDVEIECLAQTWSEHCKHKIFQARIHYVNGDIEEEIDGVFGAYIKKSTKQISQTADWVLSVFHDNAGVIRLTDEYHLAFKAETHNSPSALDPYGGALTGILGVQRDIMGTGIGARLLANTNVLCFASPDYQGAVPERLFHPKRVLQGVRKGIEDGGNKMGVPTVNGSVVFDERYLGKPLVYCGSVGIMPAEVKGIASESKSIVPGDLVVLCGGLTGRDGIHGATFSSEALQESSPTSAVQIGDPFTQKKVHEFLLEARDKGLYRTLTDNGAGGLSSSAGELAELSGGCTLDLDQVPLKEEGLFPWEILVSESQERMTLAVPEEHLEDLGLLATLHEVNLAVVGRFTDEGRFHLRYHGDTVGCLDLEFLHNGVPQLDLVAEWTPYSQRIQAKYAESTKKDFGAALLRLLQRPNICSRESLIRQYDHEVQGGTFVKPLCGRREDGPSDGAVMQPIELMGEKSQGIVLANGICPRYGDYDCYHMAALAVDEAIRNAVAVGADPNYIALLDNFSWPDPIYDEKENPDGKLKLAQLVRACKGLFDYTVSFGTPLISGKDSMKNDYRMGGQKISVPPTLLISALGVLPNVEKTMTMDFKKEGSLIYVIGQTGADLLGSEYLLMQGCEYGTLPSVQAAQAKQTFQAVFRAIQRGVLLSCHDCSDGGLAVALAESAMAGGLGCKVNLSQVPVDGFVDDEGLLFSESASRFIVSVDPGKRLEFKALFSGLPIGRIGRVTEGSCVQFNGREEQELFRLDLSELALSWKGTRDLGV